MRRTLFISAMCAVLAVAALPNSAQERATTGTVIDVDEGRGRLQIEPDDDPALRVSVESDSVATSYHGFGTMIAGKPEIFTGSKGLSNVRVGDRIEVRGSTRGGVVQASRVTLLGRAVDVPPVGVGDTRPRTSAATPTDDRPTGIPEPESGGVVEGTVQQVNTDEGRVVVQTRNRIVSVQTYRDTPVHYRGQVYRIENLEVGDRVRVQADPRDAQADDITAVRIDVTQSVQQAGGAGPRGMVGMLAGRVTRVEPGLDYIYVDDGRREMRVEMRQAMDARGDVIRARDIRVDELVQISGSYNRAGDLFQASTIRFDVDDAATGAAPPPDRTLARYGLVTLSGVVTGALEDGSVLTLRARDTNADERVWVTADFVIRTRGNSYATADTLRIDDDVIVMAFQDLNGNLIAQTIRLRNR